MALEIEHQRAEEELRVTTFNLMDTDEKFNALIEDNELLRVDYDELNTRYCDETTRLKQLLSEAEADLATFQRQLKTPTPVLEDISNRLHTFRNKQMAPLVRKSHFLT